MSRDTGTRARRASSLLIGAAGVLMTVVVTLAWADVGPAVVARADPGLWPEPIDTRAGFDKASRAALLVYTVELDEMRLMQQSDLRKALNLKTVDLASTSRWFDKALAQASVNYRFAARDCGADDWTCIAPVATSDEQIAAARRWLSTVPAARAAWRDDLAAFSHAYAAEQLRLAALFPKVSSEIDTFDDREWTGEGLPDTQFQLSFDDGPTALNGTTEDTLRMLHAAHRHAVFFLLGGNLQARVAQPDAAAFAAMYKNQCVASHGWEHRSHARWDAWQESVERTQALLHRAFPAGTVLPYFRPPYGQRKADSGAFFQSQGLRVALWNIDSQDWNAHVTADDVVGRMITLALLERHGVMLFHDVHPKAKAALPVIFKMLGTAVDWRDCHGAMP